MHYDCGPTDAKCMHTASERVRRLLPRPFEAQKRVAGRFVAHYEKYEAHEVVGFAPEMCPTFVALDDRIYNCGCA